MPLQKYEIIMRTQIQEKYKHKWAIGQENLQRADLDCYGTYHQEIAWSMFLIFTLVPHLDLCNQIML